MSKEKEEEKKVEKGEEKEGEEEEGEIYFYICACFSTGQDNNLRKTTLTNSMMESSELVIKMSLS